MSRDDFLRYMAEYGSIYDSPSYEGFQIFLSEQNQQIPDKRDGTQHPDTISEEKMDKELSQSGSSRSNSLSQSISNALVQDGHRLGVGSVPDRDKATSEFYCVPKLLEEIKELKWIIKEKDVQIEELMQMTKRLMQMNKEDSEMRKQLMQKNKEDSEMRNRLIFLNELMMKHFNELMMKHFPDSFPPSG